MFSVTTGEQTRVLQAHESNVVGIAINPANPLQLYSFGRDKKIFLWDYNDAIILRRYRLPVAVEHFAFAPGRSDLVYLAAFGSRVKNEETLPSYDVYEYSLDASNASEDPSDLPAKSNGSAQPTAPTLLLQMKARARSNFLVTPDGEYLILQSKRHFKVFNIASGVVKKFNHRNNISVIAIHPKQHFIATGDDIGEIIFWYVFSHSADVSDGNTGKLARSSSKGSSRSLKLKDDHDAPLKGGNKIRDDPVTTSVHWHAHRVGAITFDSSGAHMYSGGLEMVLVIWQLESGKKDWLPRLTAPIIGMSHTPDETLLAIRCSDNTIQLLNSRSRLLQVSVEGVNLATPHLDRSKLTGSPAVVQAVLREHRRSQRLLTGLVLEPRSQAFVFTATDGQVQFFSAQEDKHVYKQQVGPRNPVKSFRESRIAETVVNHVAFSRSGDWMVTVDAREDSVGQAALKFWFWDRTKTQYEINTTYQVNKAERIRAIAYHPRKDRVAVVSADGKFRIWVVRQNRAEAPADTNASRKGTNAPATPQRVEILEGVAKWRWTEESVASYRDLQPRAVSYSTDGSLLAIAYQHIVTLWSPETNTLLTTLTSPPDHEPITKLAFLSDSHFLAVCTKRRLFVWDLLTCQLKWTHVVSADVLATDSKSSRFAIYAPHDTTAPISGDSKKSESESGMDVDGTPKKNPHSRAARQAHTTDGYVMLFTPESPAPLGMWVLPSLGVRGVSFLPSRERANHNSSQTAEVQSSLVYLNGNHEFKFLLSPEEVAGEPEATLNGAPPASPVRKGKQQQQQLKNTLQLQQQFIAKLNATKLAEGPSVFTLMYGSAATNTDAPEETKPARVLPGVVMPKIATASKQKPMAKGASAHNSAQAKQANALTEQLLTSLFQSDVQVLPAPSTIFPQFADTLIFKTTAKETSVTDGSDSKAAKPSGADASRKNDDFKYNAPKKLVAARAAHAEIGAEAKILESEINALSLNSALSNPLSFMDDFFASLPVGISAVAPSTTSTVTPAKTRSSVSSAAHSTPKGSPAAVDGDAERQQSSKKRKRSKSQLADEE